MTHPLKIGITGGIGSGKSLICRIFELIGIPVYYADAESKKILESDKLIQNRIKDLFGPDVFFNNTLDRKLLGEIVFNDEKKLHQLNEILHPRVGEHFLAWVELQRSYYIIKEAAILFESGTYKDLNFVVAVSAPENLRIKRVMERDNVSAETVLTRIQHQLSEEERNRRADFIIWNDNQKLIIPQILELDKRFKAYILKS